MAVGSPHGSDSPANLHGCRVLIIEDEYFLADELDKELKLHGATIVGPVAEVSEARERIAAADFDVAILDINLRDEFAWPLADELMHRQIPFAFVTGYGAETIPQRFLNVMRWDKPWERCTVIEGVGRLCRQRSSRD